VQIKVFHISLLKPALKGVPLEKKIKINTNKDKFDIKKVLDSHKARILSILLSSYTTAFKVIYRNVLKISYT